MNQKQNRPIFYWANLNMKERHFEKKHKEPVYAPAGTLKIENEEEKLSVSAPPGPVKSADSSNREESRPENNK